MSSVPASSTPEAPAGQIALIDWLGFSVQQPEGENIGWVDAALSAHFGISRDQWKPTGRGWFGYANRVDLGDYGLLAYGGESQRGTIHVEINGQGCSRLNDDDWRCVQAWGELQSCHVTRVDLAHDDFEGRDFNIEVVKRLYHEGGFATGGRSPKARLIDDFGSGEGKTFNLGKRQHGKFLRAYEKGKQLGDPSSPWFRVEVELHNRDRVLPWDIVTDPAPYLAGSYPCLSGLSVCQNRIHTQRRACQISYEKMEGWVHQAAGKALNVMLSVHHGNAEEVMLRVARSGVPRRLAGFDPSDYDGVESEA